MRRPQLPRSVRTALLGAWDLVTSASPLVIAAAGLLWLAYWWLDPVPPKTLTLATGPAQSAYSEFGERYAKALRANGIEVVLLPTDGSSANLELLRSGKADAGFVQGGTVPSNADEAEPLLSLGDLFVEPIWLFYRSNPGALENGPWRVDALIQLRHKRLNIGASGSGVPTLMNSLFDMNHMDPGSVTLSRLDPTPATVSLLNGKIDALVFASAPEAPLVQMLLQTPGIRLMSFQQNEAYARRMPFISPVTLPMALWTWHANNRPKTSS